MTKPARYESKTPFSKWLREQPELDSRQKYFNATDVDFVWMNYKSGLWMILEEKRMFGKGKFPKIPRPQGDILRMLNNIICYSFYPSARKYMGIYLVVFEYTCPDDGKIWIGHQNNELTRDEFMCFLQFKFPKPVSHYDRFMANQPPTT